MNCAIELDEDVGLLVFFSFIVFGVHDGATDAVHVRETLIKLNDVGGLPLEHVFQKVECPDSSR